MFLLDASARLRLWRNFSFFPFMTWRVFSMALYNDITYIDYIGGSFYNEHLEKGYCFYTNSPYLFFSFPDLAVIVVPFPLQFLAFLRSLFGIPEKTGLNPVCD